MQDFPTFVPEESSRGDRAANRLAREISPYLLQHAHNPVDWYPWGEEALAKARSEDKPIFLSIGYSSCHWCHVMERESFENDEIAAVLNRHFVPIKVDREERPDIDDVYMTATQVISGRGGWPNSVFLLPDGRPFYAGTYFPPSDRRGMPGFMTVLAQLASLYRDRRPALMKQAEEIERAMRSSAKTVAAGESGMDPGLIHAAIESLAVTFDSRFGGFGPAPKFPPHGALRFLLHEWAHRGEGEESAMAMTTLDRMAFGGIHDHLAGGFARYSTDETWLVPHFEKMLYDNAQLLRNYAKAFALSRRPEYRRAAEGIVAWLRAEMTDADGAFFSALDADSEGVEGKYYVFARKEILDCLGPDGEDFCEVYGIAEAGNFVDSVTGVTEETNILHREISFEEIASGLGEEPAAFSARMGKCLDSLLARRRKRIGPGLDDKIQASWTALMIGALASASSDLGDAAMLSDAVRAAEFVLGRMKVNGRLMHAYREGVVRGNGFLDDHAFMAEACLDLFEATREAGWLDKAIGLVREIQAQFLDDASGACYFTAHDHEQLLLRNRDAFDKAEPSGNGVLAIVLARLAGITGEDGYRRAAERVIGAFSGLIARAPTAGMSLVLAAAMLRDLKERRIEAEVAPVSGASGGVERARAAKFPIAVEVSPATFTLVAGETVLATIAVRIDDGWHINSNRPGMEYMRPLIVTLEKPGGDGDEIEGVTLVDVVYPQGEKLRPGFGSGELSVYRGGIEITAKVAVSSSERKREHDAAIVLSFQACDDTRCLARDEVAVPVVVRVEKGSF